MCYNGLKRSVVLRRKETIVMKDIVKYGVIGLGRGADVAVTGIGNPHAKLVAACDYNPEIMAKAKETFEKAYRKLDCKDFINSEE